MAAVTSRDTLIDYCLRRLGQPVIEINVDTVSSSTARTNNDERTAMRVDARADPDCFNTANA